MRHSARKLAADLKLNRETVSLVLMSAYKKKQDPKRIHGRTSATVEKRFKRAKILRSSHAGDEIFFSDEKMFVLEQQLNVQNECGQHDCQTSHEKN
jgi:hypothetical protein